MERSTIHLLAKRGKSQRQIAQELGRNRRTIARVLQEPVAQTPAKRQRDSIVDPYRPQIAQWVRDGLTAQRMLELVRTDPEQPYLGGHSVWRAYVRRVRDELAQAQAIADVPIRFEGMPAEYLQVDWGKSGTFPSCSNRPRRATFLPAG